MISIQYGGPQLNLVGKPPCFSADAGLDLEKLSNKFARLSSEISLCAMLRAIRNKIARLRAVKQYSDAATLLLCGAAAGGCQTQFDNCDKGS